MTQIIKQDSIDFNALIKNSTILTLDGQSKMIDTLTKEFNEEEARWYIANLYVYMNYHPTNDFPISLDTLVKLVGFAHKKNAKRTLENNFIKDEDYKITVLPREHGKFSEEKIMLNIDTFKNTHLFGVWGLGISSNNFGSKVPKRTNKKVSEYNAITNELIRSWESLSVASRHLNIPVSTLSNYCRFNTRVSKSIFKYT